MKNPIIIYGEPIQKDFFYNLLNEKESKYLTEFKRYFNYLKKNHNSYKRSSIKDLVSIDKPINDYVDIISDWLELETDTKYTIYLDHNDNLFFGFKLTNPINGDIICKIVKDWNKLKSMKEDYFKWISKFDSTAEGPLFYSLM